MLNYFLEPKVPQPRTKNDYKQTIFSFDTKTIHPIDQMDLHKKSGEMIFSTLTTSAMTAAKTQTSVQNIQT